MPMQKPNKSNSQPNPNIMEVPVSAWEKQRTKFIQLGLTWFKFKMSVFLSKKWNYYTIPFAAWSDY